jgi:hypothetical protein
MSQTWRMSQPTNLATVRGLDPGLAIFRLHLRDEACLADGSVVLMAMTGPRAVITEGIRT